MFIEGPSQKADSFREKIHTFFEENRIKRIDVIGYVSASLIALSFTIYSLVKTYFSFQSYGFSIRGVPIYLFYGTFTVSGFFYTEYLMWSIKQIYSRKKEIDSII